MISYYQLEVCISFVVFEMMVGLFLMVETRQIAAQCGVYDHYRHLYFCLRLLLMMISY